MTGLQSWNDKGQNRESGRSSWWAPRGSSANVEYATAANGGHVADGASNGGGETHG